MGLLDSIRDRASAAVSQVKQKVSDTVETVENKAAAIVDKVETKAVEVGHDVKSGFDSAVGAAKNLPSPPPPSFPHLKSINVGPASLKNDLSKAIADQLKTPQTSTDAQTKAADIKARHTSMGGMNVDEKAIATELSELAKKDPAAAAPIIREVMNKLDGGDKDDVAQIFAHQMASNPAQLAALAQHPDGAAALGTMAKELRSGFSTSDEKAMAATLEDAVTKAGNAAVPNTKVENMANGASGVFNDATGNKKTATGPISADQWADPSKLVGQLSQTPAQGEAPGNTCAPSSMLASTLMAGPEKAGRFIENVGRSEDAKNLTVADRQSLIDIGDRVRNKTATFEDLNKAQGLLFKAGNTHGDTNTIGNALTARGMNPAAGPDANGKTRFKNLTDREGTELRTILAKDSPWTDQEVARMQELSNRATGMSIHMEKVDGNWAPKIEGDLAGMDPAGFSDAEARKLASMGGLKSNTGVPAGDTSPPSMLAAKLQPGEAISVRVSGDPNGSASDHFITVGRRDDGTLYLYNSDPATRDASLTVGGKGDGTPEFKELLRSYDRRQLADPNGKMPNNIPYRLD